MQEITELKQMGENQTEAQKRAIERAEAILQKYKKIALISQNVLRVRKHFSWWSSEIFLRQHIFY